MRCSKIRISSKRNLKINGSVNDQSGLDTESAVRCYPVLVELFIETETLAFLEYHIASNKELDLAAATNKS